MLINTVVIAQTFDNEHFITCFQVLPTNVKYTIDKQRLLHTDFNAIKSIWIEFLWLLPNEFQTYIGGNVTSIPRGIV